MLLQNFPLTSLQDPYGGVRPRMAALDGES